MSKSKSANKPSGNLTFFKDLIPFLIPFISYLLKADTHQFWVIWLGCLTYLWARVIFLFQRSKMGLNLLSFTAFLGVQGIYQNVLFLVETPPRNVSSLEPYEVSYLVFELAIPVWGMVIGDKYRKKTSVSEALLTRISS